MSKFVESVIECPFYLKEGDCFIACEGVIAGSECVHRFKTNKIKTQHEMSVCSSHGGKSCQHFRSVSILYERGLKI